MESCDCSRSSLINGPVSTPVPAIHSQVRRVRDVYTAPPTELLVSDAERTASANPDGSFTIPASWVEVTEGWLRKDGAHQLSICFMHSFGKCSGRCNNDPSTCHQIHIPSAYLNRVRQLYTHPLRNFFSRTVKAKLPPALRQMLVTHLRRSTVSLAYLEYYAQDVQPTTGYHAYEEEYGRWLRSSGLSTFDSASTEQCVEFALTGQCRVGLGCRFVHAPLSKALTRDKGVMAALQAMEQQVTSADIIPAPPDRNRPAPVSYHMEHRPGVPPPPMQHVQPQQPSLMWSPVVFPTPHHDQSHAFNAYQPSAPMVVHHGPMIPTPPGPHAHWQPQSPSPYALAPAMYSPATPSHTIGHTQHDPMSTVQVMLVQPGHQGPWHIG